MASKPARAQRLPQDRSAVGQVVAFLVAGAIFCAAVGGVLLATRGSSADASEADSARQDLEAAGLADLFVGSAGVGWAGGPEALERLGLAAANGSGLEQSSLDALRGGLAVAADNGKVDYPEALASLGLPPDGEAGFHLRVYPLVDDVHETALSGLKVGYIGDWTSLASIKISSTTALTNMAVSANAQLNLTMFGTTIKERQALDGLGVSFIDRVYVTTTTPSILVDFPLFLPDLPLLGVLNLPLLEGDVYPDNKAYLEAVLPGRLSRYDVLIVGAGVDHSTLVKDTIKDGIRDWVLDGGSLVALGSDEQSTSWISPLLNVGVQTVNGAPTAPDVAHPLLKQPNDLAWTSYDSHGQGWDILDSGEVTHYDDFSHVIIQEGEDVLAVSKMATFGDGRVILTTYRVRDIAVAQGAVEASHFFENLLAYADRGNLYLDYGGTVPADQPVALAVRQSWLWDSVYGQVPVRVEVLTWGSS